MTQHLAVCSGDHDVYQPLVIIDAPDDVTPAQLQAASAGYLCEDCGTAAQFFNVRIPARAQVDAAMQAFKRNRHNPR